MNINLKKIKALNVYKAPLSYPWGTVSNLSINPHSGKIDALIVDTISLIPLRHNIKIENISIKKNSIYLKNAATQKSSACSTELNIGDPIILPDNNLTKLRDLNFNLETGEITDIVVSRGRLSKKNKISINKFRVKDNTIYID